MRKWEGKRGIWEEKGNAMVTTQTIVRSQGPGKEKGDT